jgi:hypothetical protein
MGSRGALGEAMPAAEGRMSVQLAPASEADSEEPPFSLALSSTKSAGGRLPMHG